MPAIAAIFQRIVLYSVVGLHVEAGKLTWSHLEPLFSGWSVYDLFDFLGYAKDNLDSIGMHNRSLDAVTVRADGKRQGEFWDDGYKALLPHGGHVLAAYLCLNSGLAVSSCRFHFRQSVTYMLMLSRLSLVVLVCCGTVRTCSETPFG